MPRRPECQTMPGPLRTLAATSPEDIRVGTWSTKVADLVNRGVEFDALYVYPPLLDACTRIIGRRFKLSSLQARTLHARSDAQ